jgi:hypothetical protein
MTSEEKGTRGSADSMLLCSIANHIAGNHP